MCMLGNVKPRSMLKSVWRKTTGLIFTIVCARPKVRPKVGRSLLLGIHGQTELWLYGRGLAWWLKGYGWGYLALAFVESLGNVMGYPGVFQSNLHQLVLTTFYHITKAYPMEASCCTAMTFHWQLFRGLYTPPHIPCGLQVNSWSPCGV